MFNGYETRFVLRLAVTALRTVDVTPNRNGHRYREMMTVTF
jgi:hypothetical protein